MADSGKDLLLESTTKKIQSYSVGNQNRVLVDTPALDESVLMELRRKFSFAQADVIAFVISAQRLQTEEMSCIQMFLRDMKAFHNRSFILLTGGNSPVNNTSVTFDPERSPELYCLYEAVGKRWVAFDKENSDNFDKFWTISQEIIYKENCLWVRRHMKKLFKITVVCLGMLTFSRSKLRRIALPNIGSLYDSSIDYLYYMSSHYFQNVSFCGLECFFVDLFCWTL